MVYVSVIVAIIVLSFGVISYKGGGWSVLHRRIIGWLVVFYGIYLATLTGSYTSLALPGIGSIAIGASTGAAIGFGTWLAIGTVGIATGGIGIAVGAGSMALIGAAFGGAGGLAGGFGIKTVSYPLVTPFYSDGLIKHRHEPPDFSGGNF